MDEEIRAVVLAAVVLAGLLAVSQAITEGRVVEPFSALGTLGPNMKIGDYPKAVLAGEPFRLYLYVENHEGRVMYYRVLAKVGDNSTLVNETVPADLPPLASYEVILCHGENSTIPAEIALPAPAQNARLIFELWAAGDGGAWEYTGRWNHLWINATLPP